MKLKKLNVFALVVSKVLEIFHWIGGALMLGMLIVSLAARDWLCEMLAQGGYWNEPLITYGFAVTAGNLNGTINGTALTVFFLGGFFTLTLLAMVFRNVYLILRTAQGKTKYAKGATPFQEDVTRMVREIGIFLIAATVVQLLVSAIGSAVLGPGITVVQVNLVNLILGVLMLCLSQMFDYGETLQNDVDGLL